MDDLAHHPTLLGLISAILVQYLGVAIFSGQNGDTEILLVEIDKEKFIKNMLPIVMSGITKWLLYMAERKDIIEIDEELPKPIQVLIEKIYAVPAAISILKTVDNWYGHLVSDMGGSKNTPDGGMGIPGVFLSFLKELSMMPGIKDSDLPGILKDLRQVPDGNKGEKVTLSQFVNELYQGTKASPLTDKLDLRTELTVFNEQKLPVEVNEILVRMTYFIYHLTKELQNNELKDIRWKNIVPFYNRTIIRMITISTATMEAIDLADAAVRAAQKSGGTLPGFAAQFVLRINFVGIGRMAIACTTDATMGLKKTRYEYALASAEVAIVADEMVETIDKIETISGKTNKRVSELRHQTKELSKLKF